METLIRQALKEAGLDEELHTRISVTSEAHIPDAVKKLKRELDIEKISEALKPLGLKETLDKVIESVVDSRVNQALKHRDEKDKREREGADAKSKAGEGTEKKDTTLPPELAELHNLVKSLTEEVKSLKAENTKASRESIVKAALKAAEIPERFLPYITGDTEDAINAQVEDLKGIMLSERQAINDKILAEGGIPGAGSRASSATEAAVIDFAKSRVPSGSPGGGLASQQIAKNRKG